jgi:hypothetical protein
MRLSEDEYQRLLTSRKQQPAQSNKAVQTPKEKMNGLEKSYAQYLEFLKKAGEIKDWKFEPINFRLADKCFYKIDFLIRNNDDSIEFHETKGRWEDDALVKFKVVAEMYPFWIFKAIMRKDGQFYVERVG